MAQTDGKRGRRLRGNEERSLPLSDKLRTEAVVIHHVSLGTNDVGRSKRFYDAVLPILGIMPIPDLPRGCVLSHSRHNLDPLVQAG